MTSHKLVTLKGLLILLGFYPDSLLQASPLAQKCFQTWTILLTILSVQQIQDQIFFIHDGLTLGWFTEDMAGVLINVALSAYQISIHLLLLVFRFLIIRDFFTNKLAGVVRNFATIAESLTNCIEPGTKVFSRNEGWFLFVYIADFIQRLVLFTIMWFPSSNGAHSESAHRAKWEIILAAADNLLTNILAFDTLSFVFLGVVKYFEGGLVFINSRLENILKDLKAAGEKRDNEMNDFSSPLPFGSYFEPIHSSAMNKVSVFHITKRRQSKEDQLFLDHVAMSNLLRASEFHIGIFALITFFLFINLLIFDSFFACTAGMDLGFLEPAALGFVIRTLISLAKLISLTNAVHYLTLEVLVQIKGQSQM